MRFVGGPPKDCLALDSFFKEDRDVMIVLRYISRNEYKCVFLSPGYAMVYYSAGHKGVAREPGRYDLDADYWVFIVRLAGNWKVPIGEPCTDEKDGYSFILYLTVTENLADMDFEKLARIIPGSSDKVVKLRFFDLKEDFKIIFNELLEKIYGGNPAGFRADKEEIYKERLVDTMLQSESAALKMVPLFLNFRIMNFRVQPKEKCGRV